MKSGVTKVGLVALVGTIIGVGVHGCKKSEDYYNRGDAHFKKGETDQAISDFTKAIKINPGLAVAYAERAFTYYLKREYDRAWEDVYKAESLGQQIRPGFLKVLRKDSGRQR